MQFASRCPRCGTALQVMMLLISRYIDTDTDTDTNTDTISRTWIPMCKLNGECNNYSKKSVVSQYTQIRLQQK